MSTKDQSHKAVSKALAEDAPLTQAQRAILMGLVHDDEAWQRECAQVARELAAVTAERDALRTNANQLLRSLASVTSERELAIATVAEEQKIAVLAQQREAQAKAEQDALLIELHAVMTSSPAHIYMGSCPVLERSPNDRDPDCPACRRLTEIDAAIAASKEKP